MVTVRQNGALRREALLDAALMCFEKKGLVQTGIEDIRKAARASPSSVYHLFKGGLPELIAALLERTFTHRFEWVTARVVKTKNAEAAVRALVDAHLDWVFSNRAEAHFMYRVLALEAHDDHRDAVVITKARLKTELTEHLIAVRALARQPFAQGLIDVVVLGVTHQACRAWFLAPGTIDVRWMKRNLPTLAWQTTRALRNLE